MTKQATAAQASDLDYDLAQLGEPLNPDQLEVLDSVLEARDNARDFIALLEIAQKRVESGAGAFEVRDQVANDLLDIAAVLVHKARELGGGTFFGFDSDI